MAGCSHISWADVQIYLFDVRPLETAALADGQLAIKDATAFCFLYISIIVVVFGYLLDQLLSRLPCSFTFGEAVVVSELLAMCVYVLFGCLSWNWCLHCYVYIFRVTYMYLLLFFTRFSVDACMLLLVRLRTLTNATLGGASSSSSSSSSTGTSENTSLLASDGYLSSTSSITFDSPGLGAFGFSRVPWVDLGGVLVHRTDALIVAQGR